MNVTSERHCPDPPAPASLSPRARHGIYPAIPLKGPRRRSGEMNFPPRFRPSGRIFKKGNFSCLVKVFLSKERGGTTCIHGDRAAGGRRLPQPVRKGQGPGRIHRPPTGSTGILECRERWNAANIVSTKPPAAFRCEVSSRKVPLSLLEMLITGKGPPKPPIETVPDTRCREMDRKAGNIVRGRQNAITRPQKGGGASASTGTSSLLSWAFGDYREFPSRVVPKTFLK